MTTRTPYLLRDAATAVNIRQAEDVRNWTRTPATVGEHLSRGAYSRPRHIDYLAEKIAEIAERQVFLDINMPPQHGKSELVSHWTPVWFLKKFPWKKVGLASYEYQYASEWGGKAKDTITDNADELGLEIRRDTKAKGRWNLRGYGGGMFVAGIGGPFTGRGFDCITGKTRISTEYGEIPIEALYNGTPSGKILSYDIERGCLEYKKAQAFRRRKVKGLYRITTASGRMVEATGNHRFWTDRGYIPTNLLSAGDNFLCLVPEGIHKTGVRGIQSDIQAGSQGILLLSEMLESSSCNQERSPMRKMWSPYAWDTYETILQSGMPEETAMVTSMPNVQEVFLSQRFETTILLQGMCERCPFPENEGQREFSLQERSIIRKMLRINETLYPSEGQELCSMWVKEEVIRTPYKQCTNGQSTRKSGCALFDVPYNSSSLCRDTISTVERICGSEDYVYDIQVEKNHNFFAEGILAHNCIIIDDPIKNDQEALSPVYRRRIWNWYRTVARTRLAPGGSIILIMCMTGDTPVLMADGIEKPLSEVKIGDKVATYDNGKLAISTVINHQSNGLDSVFKIKTTCGKIVEANVRHPFLVEEQGELKWIRLKNLTTGHRIVTLKDNGVNGKERFASLRDATIQSGYEVIVPHITTKKCGQMGIVLLPLMRNLGVMRVLNTDMESPPLNMMQCIKHKMANVQSVENRQELMSGHIGVGNYALTTTMKAVRLEDYCAMTAISPWHMPKQKKQHLPLLNTSDFTTTPIESIEPIGVKEVFDIQIENTENFIANGLVSHNTRWHEQDLAGALLGNPPEEEGEEILEEDVEPDAWEEINLMALAEEGDPLGRRLGQALWPERYDETALKKSRMAAGPFWWSAQYRGKPQPEGGGIIKTYWFKSYEDDELPKNYSRIIQIWDTAYKEKQKHDRSACLTLGQAARPRRYYLLDLYVARIPFPDLNRAAEAQYDKWNPDRVLIEDKASGISLIQQLRRDTHVPIRAIPAVDDKVTRAHTITGILEAGLVSVPRHASWLADFLKEIADFPNGAHDDIVDVLVHGLRYLKPRLKQGRRGVEREEKTSRWRE